MSHLISNIAFWLPLAAIAALWLYMLIRRQVRMAERTIDEVTVFLRKVDWDETLEVFDLARERYLRIVQSDAHFRRTMRVRIHKAREFMARMYHNVRVVHEWATTELNDIFEKPPETCTNEDKKLRAIAEMAREFRMLATIRMIKLTIWMVLRIERWPIVRIPSIASLRHCGAQGNIDLIELYDRLKNAAADVALTYGPQFSDEIQASL